MTRILHLMKSISYRGTLSMLVGIRQKNPGHPILSECPILSGAHLEEVLTRPIARKYFHLAELIESEKVAS